MLPIRRRNALFLAILLSAAMAARASEPASQVSSATLMSAVALSAGLDDEFEDDFEDDFGDEEDFGEDEEFAEDESEVDEDDGEESSEDDSESPADDEDDIDYVDDYEDDAWAPELEDEDYAEDDAIPFEDGEDGEAVIWDVEAVAGESGVVETTGDREDQDSVGVGQILELTAPKAAPAEGTPRRYGSTGGAPAGEDVPYAFGGRPVAARAVPWQAQIFNPGVARNADNPRPIWMRQHNCGGALIADDWVITAAHCIDQAKVDLGFKVRLGAQDLSRGDGLVYRIERIVRHSQYDPGSRDLTRPPNMYANDIALVRIVPDGPAQRRDPQLIRPIPLNRNPLPGGAPVTVTGWGAVGAEAGQAGSAVILRVDLRLMDQRTCESRPGRGGGKVHDKVFCAASPRQATCSGDSGGPVVPTNGTPVLAGLVSWGSSRCGGDGRPSVYTRVDQYLTWIEEAMRLPAPRNALP